MCTSLFGKGKIILFYKIMTVSNLETVWDMANKRVTSLYNEHLPQFLSNQFKNISFEKREIGGGKGEHAG